MIRPGLYKHYQGGLYWVQGIGGAKNVPGIEDGTPMVIYRAVETMETHVQPLSFVTEIVSPGKGKRKVQRFERVEKA